MSSVAESTAGSVTKTPRILACVLCQHRKIKCDRRTPCNHCIRANVQCTPSTPAPARKRRRPNQDLQERLARCEELLKEYATEGKEPSPRPSNRLEDSPLARGEEKIQDWNRTGKLIHDDGSVRFVDSYMLSTVYDELKAMREIIDNDEPTPEDDASDSMTPDTNTELFFGGESPQTAVSTTELQPNPSHIFVLWQVFLDRVNPLTKILHVPTLQPHLVAAAAGAQLPRSIEALLFSIYTLAVVSLTGEECNTLLGMGRDKALHRFSAGVRLTLTRIGFLKTHDMTSLQALVLYLFSLQGRYNRHAAWVLNGVVIRIAQKMGLHRDGTHLGLSPFETEMRRRLWFQILSIDVKTAIMSGLGHSLLPRVWDTQEPKNVNDADLHPSTSEPIRDRDGPTEMIFVLLSNKIARFIVDSPCFEPLFLYNDEGVENIPGAPSKERLREYRVQVEEMAKSVSELLDMYCDAAAGPLHEFTVDFRATIMQRVKDMLNPTGLDDVLTEKDHLFRVAVEGLEEMVRNYQSSYKAQFLWYMRIQFHSELFVYVAGQLCNRSSGPLVDRAWEAVDGLLQYHPEVLNVRVSKENMLLGSCLVRGWDLRQEHIRQHMGLTLPTPPYIATLRSKVPQEYLKQSANNSPATGSSSSAIKPKEEGMAGGKFLATASPMGAGFDDLMGGYNYLDGGEWDVFSALNMSHPSAGLLPGSNGGPSNVGLNPNGSSQPPMPTFGSFGLGPTTQW